MTGRAGALCPRGNPEEPDWLRRYLILAVAKIVPFASSPKPSKMDLISRTAAKTVCQF